MVTGDNENIFLNIFLYDSTNNLPTLRSYKKYVANPNKVNNIGIKGECPSRLDEVRTYNQDEPFIIGINGVDEITNNYITYHIDGINYKTNINTNETTFEVGIRTNIGSFENFTPTNDILYRDDTDVTIETGDITNSILIERKEISVFSSFYNLARLNEPQDSEIYFN